jgi:Fe-S cluster biogenesis protein NfuA
MDLEARVRGRLDDVSRLMNAHAGGLELIDLDDNGGVTVKFTGMCVGCPFRPMTMAGTIRPALLAIEGVESVRATGSRISEEAEERLAAALSDSPRASAWWLEDRRAGAVEDA